MNLSILALIILLLLIGKLLCKFIFVNKNKIFNNAIIRNIVQKDNDKSIVTIQPVKDIPDFMVTYEIVSIELQNYKIGDTVRLEIASSNGKAYIGDTLNNYLLFIKESIVDIVYYSAVVIFAILVTLGYCV